MVSANSSANRSIASQIETLSIADDFASVTQLLQQKKVTEAQKIIDKAIAQQPAWWTSEQMKAKLFILAAQAAASTTSDSSDRELLPLCIAGKDLDVHFSNEQNITPLMAAAEAHLSDCVNTLLLKDASLTSQDSHGKYAWEYIVQNLGASFLTDNYDITNLNNYSNAVGLIASMLKKNQALAEFFIDRLLALPEGEQPAWWKRKYTQASLLGAAIVTHADAIIAKLKNNVDIYEDVGFHQTPLLLAAENGYKTLVLEFLQRPDIATEDHFPKTWQAISTIGKDFARTALSKIPFPDAKSAETAVCYFASKKLPEELKLLITHISFHAPSWLNSFYTTCFFQAAANGLKDIASALLPRIQLDAYSSLHNSKTPLAMVIEQKWIDMAAYLISKGVPLIKDSVTKTSLLPEIEQLIATTSLINQLELNEKGTFDFLRLLITNKSPGAIKLAERYLTLAENQQPSWWKEERNSLFITACLEKANDFILFLQERTISIDVPINSDRETLLAFAAVMTNNAPLVSALLKRGASLFVKDTRGNSAWQQIQRMDDPMSILSSIPLQSPQIKDLLSLSLAENDWKTVFSILDRMNSADAPPTWWQDTSFQQSIQKILSSDIATHALPNDIGPKKKSYLMVLAELKWESTLLSCVTRPDFFVSLLQKDTAQKTSFDYITELLDASVIKKIITARPATHPETFTFIIDMCKLGKPTFALFLLTQAEEQKALWLNNTRCRTSLFCWAASSNNETLCKKLATLGLDLDYIDSDHRCTALHAAANRGLHDIVLQLLNQGANIDLTDGNGLSAWKAIEHLGTATVKEIATSMTLQNDNIFPRLRTLLNNKQKEAATIILRRLQSEQPNWWKQKPLMLSAVFYAAVMNDFNDIAAIILPYIEVNAITSSGKFLLQIAIEKNWKEGVIQLAERGAFLHDTNSSQLSHWEQIEKQFGTSFLHTLFSEKIALSELPLAHLIPSILSKKREDLITLLIDRVQGIRLEDRPLWVHDKTFYTTIFHCATKNGLKKLAESFATSIDPTMTFSYLNNASPLHLAAEQGWKDMVISLVLQSPASLTYTNNTGEHAWEAIVTHCGNDLFFSLIKKLPPSALDTTLLMQCTKNTTVSEFLFTLIEQLPSQDRPAYWQNKKAMTELFCAAAAHKNLQICERLLYGIHAPIDVYLRASNAKDYTPLIFAAANGWKDLVLNFIAMGSPLQAMDSDGILALEHILKSFPNSNEQQEFFSFCTKEVLTEPDLNGISLLAHMANKNLPCGILAPLVKTALTFYGIPQELCTPTTSLATIRKHVQSAAYIASTSVTTEKKQQALLLLTGDKEQIRYFNLLSYTLKPSHMSRSSTTLKNTAVKELPERYNLAEKFEALLSFSLPSWANERAILDDETERSKAPLVEKMRTQIQQLNDGKLCDYYGRSITPNNQIKLKNIYGNICIVFLQKIATINTLSTKQKEDLALSVRSFIQSLGVTFFHCADRVISDSVRYYEHIVNNVKVTVEEQTKQALDEIFFEELIRLRQRIFTEIYFSTTTDKHDAATERYMRSTLNEEFGLFYPAFEATDSYQGAALQDKIAEIRQRFFDTYTPVRVASHINTTIRQGIEAQVKGGVKQNWYSRIQAFLEDKEEAILRLKIEIAEVKNKLEKVEQLEVMLKVSEEQAAIAKKELAKQENSPQEIEKLRALMKTKSAKYSALWEELFDLESNSLTPKGMEHVLAKLDLIQRTTT